jgi:ankyrin repeat protein
MTRIYLVVIFFLIALSVACEPGKQHDSSSANVSQNTSKVQRDIPVELSFNEKALIGAASLGQTRTVQDLIKRGVSVNTRNKFAETVLSLAARGGHADTVKLLLDSGADPNSADREGVADSMHFLLDRGDNGNLVMKDGYTPLMWAAQNGHLKVVQILLTGKADPNKVSYYTRTTALINVAPHDSGEITKLLIAHGADVNARNYDGRTALMEAAEVGNPKSVKVLLDAGTDLTIKDNMGKTVFDIVQPPEGLRVPFEKDKWATFELINKAKSKMK